MTELTRRQQVVLDVLREAAKAGRRCPTNDEIRELVRQRSGLSPHPHRDTIPALARFGYCRVEVYALNWRVVEIDGHRTQEAPPGHEPYRVIGKDLDYHAGRDQRAPEISARRVERLSEPEKDPPQPAKGFNRRCVSCQRVFRTANLDTTRCSDCAAGRLRGDARGGVG